MIKTIAQLYNGDLEPLESFGKSNSEMKRLWAMRDCNFEKLEQCLSEEQHRIFQAYCEYTEEYIDVANEQAFCDGFCLGVKIAAEALTE